MSEASSEVATRPNPQLTGFMPGNLEDAMQVAKSLAYSDIVPRDLRGKPGNVFVVMMYGAALNLPIAVAMNTISVVNGRPKLEAKLVLSLVRKAGHRVEWIESTDDRATLRITRGDSSGDSFEGTFTVADAVIAELCTIGPDGKPRARSSQRQEKLPWEKYARRMLRWRVVDEVTDVICPEVKMGFGVEGDEVPEEAPRPTLARVVAQRTSPEPQPETGADADAPVKTERDDDAIAAEIADIETEHATAGPNASAELPDDDDIAAEVAAYEVELAERDGQK